MAYTTIDDGSVYFQTKLYTGNETDDTALTNTENSDLQPDWIWIKSRGSTQDHQIIDTSRGLTEAFSSNRNDTNTFSDGVKSIQSDGFTLGVNTRYNQNSTNFVAWQWKANGGTTTSNGASGDIKASVTQREDTAKFSICTYTGTGINAGQSHRVNHGLGTTPHVMIFKSRGASGDWVVYHHKNTASPETDYLVLNSSAATVDSANKFNDTAPNTSYATIGGDDNISSGTMLLYSFAEVQGYSKFGIYTGNGNTDGTFVYTGFRVAWVLLKRTDSGNNWHLHDAKRSNQGGGNPADDILYPNLENAEADEDVDLLSNGFKLRVTGGGHNASGGSYIYMAFAEHPFVSSEGVPCTAR